MYNEVRERRAKRTRGGGDCRGRWEEAEGTVEEVEEEGRQTILAKDRRYSNAIVAAAAACTAKHFCRLPWLQDNRHFFPPSQARKYPVPFCINPPSSCTAAFFVLVSLPPRRAADATAAAASLNIVVLLVNRLSHVKRVALQPYITEVYYSLL